MKKITLALKDDESLEELLAGVFVFRVYLTDDGDGTYGLHAQVPVSTTPLAYLRLGWERAAAAGQTGGPEPPEPEPEVANAMERLAIRLGWKGEAAAE